ncbi:Fur family transcriptional regulator [Nocardioides houyundeii]|uniref:Fur family transcriptional regulator n=1 Tax=Nocardioides houyundeii TaxID=2045452 RepID=UPI000DF323F6|nr:Fur family transcriptional regulator [Nocardioides houyundeii]
MAEHELAQALRGSGYRLTPQRQLVLAAVEELGHATPDELRDHVGGACNISTVYRALEVLEELGLVRHTHLSDRAPTYHSAREAEHFHLVCRNCGKVTSVDPDRAAPFLARLRTEHGFVTDVGHLAIFGRCEECPEVADEGDHPHDHLVHQQENR